ncbi:hypothetical protein [Ruegeria sp. HKCCD8929]|uniref:hypothetical protein n=1 Tax=Ruegeria sp. HKCCD8929 TaxID=2683006 RepID=UPI0014878AFD|nr:hypothetical protein [Ruegeria sp. HKCCD8929]
MPILIAAVGILAAVFFFLIHARRTAEMAGELADMANDVRLAARRFGFRRNSSLHPVEAIDDPDLAIAAMAIAFQELDGLPTQDQRDRLHVQLRKTLSMDAETAEEAIVLSRWLVAQCGGADPALSRIGRKLFKLAGTETLQPLLSVIRGSLDADADLTVRQKEALGDIQRVFKL